MGDPVTIGLMVVSGIASAAGYVMQGNAAAAAGKANKAQLDAAAHQRRQQGVIAAQRVRRQADVVRGKQMAAFAAQGIDLFSGSPLELLSETAKEYEWRANATRWQGEAEAIELINRGQLAKWQGKVQRNVAYAQAVASLLKAGGNVYGQATSGPTSTPTAGTAPPMLTPEQSLSLQPAYRELA